MGVHLFDPMLFLRERFPRVFFHLCFPRTGPSPHMELGQLGETHVAHRLRAAGWQVLAQRALAPSGEIDLVAMQADVLVLVEVKSGLWPMGESQLDLNAQRWRPGHRFSRDQLHAYKRALPQLQARLPGGPARATRIDLIEVLWRHARPWPALVHHVGLTRPLSQQDPCTSPNLLG